MSFRIERTPGVLHSEYTLEEEETAEEASDGSPETTTISEPFSKNKREVHKVVNTLSQTLSHMASRPYDEDDLFWTTAKDSRESLQKASCDFRNECALSRQENAALKEKNRDLQQNISQFNLSFLKNGSDIKAYQCLSNVCKPVQSSGKGNPIEQAYYFYSKGSNVSLEGILRGKQIQPTEIYGSGFISTKPTHELGRVILGFNRSIEDSGLLNYYYCRSDIERPDCRASSNREIPVTKDTLTFIAIHDPQPNELTQLKNRCRLWTGRDIPVIPYKEVHEVIQARDLRDGISVNNDLYERNQREHER